MARNWIVRGDPTSSGGSVISGSPFTDIDGIAVARITDQATCLKHRGVFPIVEGDATLVVDGQPVALHGSALACGCKVLSAAQMHVFVDAGAFSASSARLAGALEAFGNADVSPLKEPPETTVSPLQEQPEKRIVRVYWSYGPDKSMLQGKSRFYVDLNVHAETENFAPGDAIEIAIESNSDAANEALSFTVTAVVGPDNIATASNVFEGKHVELYATE